MIFKSLESKKDLGVLALRLVIGWRLIAGAWNVISNNGMDGVIDFFNQLHLPMPNTCAYISVYAQFICGVLFIIGLFTRYAAATMIINFAVAIIVYDIHHGIEKAFPAWIILAASFFFLFNG